MKAIEGPFRSIRFLPCVAQWSGDFPVPRVNSACWNWHFTMVTTGDPSIIPHPDLSRNFQWPSGNQTWLAGNPPKTSRRFGVVIGKSSKQVICGFSGHLRSEAKSIKKKAMIHGSSLWSSPDFLIDGSLMVIQCQNLGKSNPYHLWCLMVDSMTFPSANLGEVKLFPSAPGPGRWKPWNFAPRKNSSWNLCLGKLKISHRIHVWYIC